jgi:hypothetical protein
MIVFRREPRQNMTYRRQPLPLFVKAMNDVKVSTTLVQHFFSLYEAPT